MFEGVLDVLIVTVHPPLVGPENDCHNEERQCRYEKKEQAGNLLIHSNWKNDVCNNCMDPTADIISFFIHLYVQHLN